MTNQPIRMHPLVNNYLQPSPPPESATRDQLDLWSRVLTNRTSQLSKLPVHRLQSIYDLLFDQETISKELSDLLRLLPSKKPTQKDHFISLVRYLLIGHFHKTIDIRLDAEERSESIESLKEILNCVDKIHCQSVSEKLALKRSVEKERQEKAKDLNKEVAISTEFDPSTSLTSPLLAGSDKGRDNIQTQSPLPPRDIEQDKLSVSTDRSSIPGNSSTFATNSTSEGKQKSSNELKDKTMGLALSRGVLTQPELQKPTKETITEVIDIMDSSEGENSDSESPVNKPLPDPKLEDSASRKSLSSRKIQQSLNLRKIQPVPRQARPWSHMGKKPLPFTLQFLPDASVPTFSASLRQRAKCSLTINYGQDTPTMSCSDLEGPGVDNLNSRFAAWDPYWKTINDCTLTKQSGYEWGSKTTPVIRSTLHMDESPKTACELEFQLSESLVRSRGSNGQHIAWGKFRDLSKAYIDGERRLILRMLPLIVPEKYKKTRADTHQWPKGTFPQLNKRPIGLSQRKQQAHDHILWKGLSYIFDMTPSMMYPNSTNQLSICTQDLDLYGVQIALCDYISPAKLYDICLGAEPGNEDSLTKLSYDKGLAIALAYVNKDAVVLDETDDENDDNNDKPAVTASNATLTLSLLCGMSMTPMITPVRGKNCKHMQCFDLRNYLQTNATVSGTRWRCGVCEDFVAPKDLIIDGLVLKMLEKYSDQVSGSRDKIQFSSDGTWKLMDENRLRYSTKKRSCDHTTNNAESNGKKLKIGEDGKMVASTDRANQHNEIIELG